MAFDRIPPVDIQSLPGSPGRPLPSVPTGSGSGSKLLNGLNMGASMINPILGGIEAVKPILDLFQTSPLGKDKQTGTGMEQNIEKAAMDIERRVMSGELTPEAALVALQGLERQAVAMGVTTGQAGTNAPFAAGANTAGVILNNVKSNILNKKEQSDSAFAATPFDGSSMAPSTEALQNRKMRTGLRNYISGAPSGLEDSPIAGALKPTSPFDHINEAMSAPRLPGRKKEMF